MWPNPNFPNTGVIALFMCSLWRQYQQSLHSDSQFTWGLANIDSIGYLCVVPKVRMPI